MKNRSGGGVPEISAPLYPPHAVPESAGTTHAIFGHIVMKTLCSAVALKT
jgi:hypothetical protein